MAVQRGAPSTGMTVSLVLFVFLFVISAALAILFYVQRSDAQMKMAEWKETLQLYAPEKLRRQLTDLEEEAKKNRQPSNEGPTTVVGLLQKRRQNLALLLTGDAEMDVPQARKELRKVGLDPGENVLSVLRGRAERIKTLRKKLKNAFDEKTRAKLVKHLEARELATLAIRLVEERASVRTDLVAAQKQLQAVRKKLKLANQRVEKLDQKLTQVEKKNQSYRQTAGKQQKALHARLDKIQAECEKKVEKLRNKLRAQKAKLSNREARIDKLESQLVTPTPSGRPTADGRIISVNPEEQLVQVNLGRQDHLVLGMTFEVYASESAMQVTGDRRLNRGKATIQVVELSESTATARLIRSSVDQPVLEEDVIANLAYDPDRVFKFFLYGDKFDLNQDGRATKYERERIVSLIREWGGEVTDRLSLDTDYVVVGEAPEKPGPQPPNPSPSEVIERQKQQKAFKKFQAIRQEAKELSIPVLNQNRFLALVGRL